MIIKLKYYFIDIPEYHFTAKEFIYNKTSIYVSALYEENLNIYIKSGLRLRKI